MLSDSDSGAYGPLPLKIVGPTLPPHLQKEKSDSTSNSSSEDTTTAQPELFGPALPPHLLKKQPQSPGDSFGPSTFPPDDEDSNDDSFGPLPPGLSSHSSAHIALEERALQLKMGQLQPKSDKPEREEWMIELPEVGDASKLGLGQRQFRKNAAPDLSDRSSWTETPQTKGKGPKDKKVDLKKEAEEMEVRKRDREQREIAEKHNKKKKRDKSLVEIHQEKLKTKKEEAGPVERRPFSRDIDLQVNRFDEAQKKAIMKKAMHLDDRFSKGKSQYL